MPRALRCTACALHLPAAAIAESIPHSLDGLECVVEPDHPVWPSIDRRQACLFEVEVDVQGIIQATPEPRGAGRLKQKITEEGVLRVQAHMRAEGTGSYARSSMQYPTQDQHSAP